MIMELCLHSLNLNLESTRAHSLLRPPPILHALLPFLGVDDAGCQQGRDVG